MSHNDSNPICDEINDNCDYVDLTDLGNISQSVKDLVVLQLNV